MNNILTAFVQTAEVKDVKEVVEETQRFFTMNDMRTILDKFIEWCASTVGTIVWALIVWVIGKKILKALLKVLGKALDRSRLDDGVTKFMLSLSRFAGNVVLVIMIIDILGFDTTSFSGYRAWYVIAGKSRQCGRRYINPAVQAVCSRRLYCCRRIRRQCYNNRPSLYKAYYY